MMVTLVQQIQSDSTTLYENSVYRLQIMLCKSSTKGSSPSTFQICSFYKKKMFKIFHKWSTLLQGIATAKIWKYTDVYATIIM